MIMVYIGIILLYLMLAIISRKHFSKYKAEKRHTPFSYIIDLYLAMGETIFEMICGKISLQKLKERLRKLQVVSEKNLDKIAQEYMIKSIAICLGIMFCVVSISGIIYIRETNENEPENIIWREGYQGNEKEYEICLDADGKSSIYNLEVAPVEYTAEEFQRKAEIILDCLETEILGDNADLAHMHSEPILPTVDESGIFQIKWISENPEYISSSGKVFWEELPQGCWVTLRAEVQYLEYSASREYTFFLQSLNYPEETHGLNMVKEKLENLEKESRNQTTVILPTEIEGVKISLQKKSENLSFQILLLGMMLSIVIMVLQYNKLKSNGDLRDHLLTQVYPEFVNQLWLFLGAGMTIKASLRKMVQRSKDKNLLVKELEYALNQLDSGADEMTTYEQLGTRLSIPFYIRLMSHISQNLRMGTKDLLRLMEDEVYASLEMRKEYAKRRGEVASTKLLFPMVLLLAITMIIVIVPAIINF